MSAQRSSRASSAPAPKQGDVARVAPESGLRATAKVPPLRTGASRFVVAMLVTLVAMSAFALWVHRRVELTIHEQAKAVIQATLEAASASLQTLLVGAQRTVAAAATDAALESSTADCLVSPAACARVSSVLESYVRAGGYVRARLAATDGRVLAETLGRGASQLPQPLVELAAPLAAGRVAVAHAERSAAGNVLLLVASVYGRDSARVGVLVVDAPLGPIDDMLRATRVGRSGETYLFDAQGRMLTNSRFVAQLQRAGLLRADQNSAALAIELRDPGRDLTHGQRAGLPRARQPLTRMAAHATRGESGLDIEGYRDYRGVPVVGAWQWLPDFRLGIAAEIDAADAYRSIATLTRMFSALIGLLTLALLASVAAAYRSTRLRERAARAEKLAERFGQYVLERKLGEGGMGVVYLARHALLRRRAAIKLLRPDRISPDALERFEHEAQITSTLTHPNTVEVYDYGRTDSGALYYVMEYLEGLDLQRLVLHFGPLPQARVLHFLRQLCGSLAEAHAAGIVHRDIKPANLVACTRGGAVDTLKVLDFGVVKLSRAELVEADRETLVVGTPEYMAPELFESAAEASPQSDLYAVGIVAHFLLTGAPAFAGEATRELCMAHLTQAPPPLVLPHDEPIDPVLDAVIRACLAKRASARPSSATSLRHLLDSSALANRWTQAEAAAWWRERSPDVAALRTSTPPSSRRSIALDISDRH